MSSMLVCVQPATGHPDGFSPLDRPALLLKHLSSRPQLSRVTPASRLEVRPTPETVSTGVAEMDALTGGLPRACLTEVYGSPSSGRTSFLLATIAAATRRQEACALVDVSDAFDPQSAREAGIDFRNLLWIRCDADRRLNRHKSSPSHQDSREQFFISPDGRLLSNSTHKKWENSLEQALKTTDLLLQSGGFGLVAIDLSDVPDMAARRIPLTSWFRFRRAVENTATVLLALTQSPCAGTCASLLLQLKGQEQNFSSSDGPMHAELLCGLPINCELERSRRERKLAQPDRISYATKTAWTR
jgi:RecA DNA recombination protein